MTHIILRRHLAAAINTAADKDTRHYLVGVHVDGRVMVATDGYCLSAYLGPECDEYLPPFTIPLETAKRIVKRKAEKLEVRPASEGWIMIGKEMVRPLDGAFPNYRRVILPAKDPAPGGVTLDPRLLVKFCAIAKALGLGAHATPWLYSTGVGPNWAVRVALGGVEDEFVGVVMPIRLRADEARPTCGEWLKA